ncbi:MAG TPA: stage II sporulation protein M, partial [Anaerolineales bacterium]|nr:stage II sporulation protein M [Anaerolineales bacterium]
MQPDQFIQTRQTQWKALTQLLDRCQRGLESLSTDDINQLGSLYRAAASDLAVAQRDFPTHRATVYLNQLVARAHAVLYRGEPLSFKRLWRFVAAGFPSTFRETWPFFVTAALLLIIPGLMAGISTAFEPASARWLLPPEVQPRIADIERQDLWTNIPIEERPYASSYIMRNNIQVSFLAFGGGVLVGLFTVWVMILNGLILGGILGLTFHYGVGLEMSSFVIGHGVIELTVIIMAGGSGLMLGWALLQPGLFRRRDALAVAARKAVKLVIGCVPLLVIAGTIEGFISPAENIPWPMKFGVGIGSGILLYGYLLLAGRKRGVTAS